MEQTKFTISLLGFDDRSADMLARTTRATMTIIDPITNGETQVVVVDMDGLDGIAIWNEFRQQWPHMPAVVICDDDPEFDNVSFAEKPFTAASLIDNITEAIILAPLVDAEVSEPDEAMIEIEMSELTSTSDSSSEMDDVFFQDKAESKSTSESSTNMENWFKDEPSDKALEGQSASEDSTDMENWFGSEGNDQAEEDDIDIDDIMLVSNSADAADYQSAKLPTDENTTEKNETIDIPQPEDISTTEEKASNQLDNIEIETSPDPEPAETSEELEVIDEIKSNDASNNDKAGLPLSEMANVLTSHSTAARELPARTLDSPNPGEMFFNPEAHMIGLVLKGISESQKSGAIAKLACLLDRTIYIDAKNKIISSNLKDIHMRQIAIAPLGKGDSGLDSELEMIKSKSIQELASSESSNYPMDAFVWELALLTSKGRVPVGTPLDKPTYLMQWPNFTRLMHSPNDMKIAAYWLRLPSSLINLSENLNVPTSDVHLIYSAAFLTGIAGEATRKSDNMIKPEKPEKHKNRNLFGSIMNKFKK